MSTSHYIPRNDADILAPDIGYYAFYFSIESNAWVYKDSDNIVHPLMIIPARVKVSTSTDLVITNEDFVLVTGTNPVTITLPASKDGLIQIKSICESVVTIVPASGTINGVASLELDPLDSPTLGEGNLGESITLDFIGGQFWRV